MSNSLSNFLTAATQKSLDNLTEAYLRLPEDKRNWSPAETSRSAADQIAECALINGGTPRLVRDRAWPADFDMAGYTKAKAALAQDPDSLLAALKENTRQAIAVISTVSEEDLAVTINMPWGAFTLQDIIAMPYWNMSYHEGQINYIASILGCLE